MAGVENGDPGRYRPMPTTSTERSPLLHTPFTTEVPRPADGSHGGIASPDGTLETMQQRSPSPDKSLSGHRDQTAANQSLGRVRRVFVSLALGSLVFLLAANMSMLSTAQSAIASELNAFEVTSWFTSAYLIPMSALSPLNGKLSDIFSPRLCMFAASLFMAIGSVMCAWATTIEGFMLGRVVSGIGGSGIMTLSIIIVLELTGVKRKFLAVGALNTGVTLGVAIGATAAGALVNVTGWRFLFWIQAPILVLGGLGILLAIPATFTSGEKKVEYLDQTTWERIKRIDYLGAATLTASLVLLLYALSSPKKIPLLPIILSILVAAAFVLVEVFIACDPIVPVSLLRSRGLLLTCLGTLGFMMARWAVLFYTPTYALGVRQWSESVGGSLLIPTNGGFAAGGLLAGWLHIRRPGSFYLPTMTSYAVFTLSMVALALLSHREGSPAAIVLVLFVCGFSTGAALGYNLAHLLHLTPKETHSVVTALTATFRGFAGSFGSAVGGGVFTRALSTSLEKNFADHGMKRDDLVRRLLGSPALVSRLHGVERDVAKQSYEDAIKALWLAAAMLAFATCFVQAGVGWRGYEEARPMSEGSSTIQDHGDDRYTDEVRAETS